MKPYATCTSADWWRNPFSSHFEMRPAALPRCTAPHVHVLTVVSQCSTGVPRGRLEGGCSRRQFKAALARQHTPRAPCAHSHQQGGCPPAVFEARSAVGVAGRGGGGAGWGYVGGCLRVGYIHCVRIDPLEQQRRRQGGQGRHPSTHGAELSGAGWQAGKRTLAHASGRGGGGALRNIPVVLPLSRPAAGPRACYRPRCARSRPS